MSKIVAGSGTGVGGGFCSSKNAHVAAGASWRSGSKANGLPDDRIHANGAASPTQLAYAYGTRVEVTEKGTTTSPLWVLSARAAHPTSSAVTGTLLKY